MAANGRILVDRARTGTGGAFEEPRGCTGSELGPDGSTAEMEDYRGEPQPNRERAP